MTSIFREKFSFFEKIVFIVCDFSVFLQVCITGVDRTLILWVLNVPVQILRVA